MTTHATNTLPARSIQIYLLAADADRPVCEAIVKYLKPVVREFAVPVQLLSDFDLPPGSEVQAHRQRLLTSGIVLALISADFISDDDIYSRVKAVTELHNLGRLVMIPLLVRNCLWKATPFARMGMLPKNFQPLNNLQFWPSADDALTAVVSDVYAALGEMTQKTEALVAQSPASAAPPAATAGAMPASAAPAPAPAAPAPAAPSFAASLGGAAAVRDVAVEWRQAYYRKIVWKRASAFAIDWVVAILVWLVWLTVYMSADPNASSQWDGTDAAVMFIIFYIVCPLLESSPWQATVGKRMMGLQITDPDGRRISFGRAFLRTVLRTVVAYTYVLSLGILLVVQYARFKKTKKLFHDELSSTLIGERLANGKAAAPTAAAAA